MIETYTNYIDRYLCKIGLAGTTSPGEHHFVSTYLLQKLYSINSTVPDYVNPDGTKLITGDIVYFLNGKHHLGIEVKLGTIRLTKNEYNTWIVNPDIASHPELFIGIGTKGIAIQKWQSFREAYAKSINCSDINSLKAIPSGYGKQKSVNEFFNYTQAGEFYARGKNQSEAISNENLFVAQLRRAIGC